MIREHATQLTSDVNAAYGTLKEPVFDAYRKRLAAEYPRKCTGMSLH
jgi:hypothetical protein